MYDSRSNLGGSVKLAEFVCSERRPRTLDDQLTLGYPLLEEQRLLNVRRHGCSSEFVCGDGRVDWSCSSLSRQRRPAPHLPSRQAELHASFAFRAPFAPHLNRRCHHAVYAFSISGIVGSFLRFDEGSKYRRILPQIWTPWLRVDVTPALTQCLLCALNLTGA